MSSTVVPRGMGQGKRVRRFLFSGVGLTRAMIEAAFEHPNIKRGAGMIHDRDPGTQVHGQGILELTHARHVATVANMFRVPVQVMILTWSCGSPRAAWARSLRYLFHSQPQEQAKGKAVYGEHELIVSRDYDWRSDLAWLDAFEVKTGSRLPLRERIFLAVSDGEMTTDDVATDPAEAVRLIYIANGQKLRQLEDDGVRRRKQMRVEALRAEEEAKREQARIERALRAEIEQVEEQRAALIAEQKRQAREAEQAARREQEAAERLAYEQSPQGIAEAAQAAQDAERDALVALTMFGEQVGTEAAVVASVTEHLDDDAGFDAADLAAEFVDSRLTHRGALMAACQSLGLEFSGEMTDDLRDEVEAFQRDLKAVGRKIAGAELRAVDGDDEELDHAVRLRKQFAAVSHLAHLPEIRSEFKEGKSARLRDANRRLLEAGRI